MVVDHDEDIRNLGFNEMGEERYTDVGDTLGEKGGSAREHLPSFEMPLAIIAVTVAAISTVFLRRSRKR